MKGKWDKIGLRYALAGLNFAIKHERNFRNHIGAMILVIIGGFLLKISQMEWLIVILLFGLVMQSELLNSAVEKLLDHTRPEIHPAAKIIKDIAAGAVLIASISAAIIGCIIFIPKIIALFN